MEYNEMFKPPTRKSMTDEQLQEALGAAKSDESGIMAAMELLEAQSALREEDNREFEEWAKRLTELATPEALHAVENGRRVNAGLEPLPFESALPLEVIQDATPVQEAHHEPQSEGAAEPVQVENVVGYDDLIAQSLNALYAPPPAPEATEVLQTQPSTNEFDQILSAEEVATAEQEEAIEVPLEVVEVERVAPPAAARVYDGEADLDVAIDPKRSSAAVSQLWPWLAISGGILPVAIAYTFFQLQLTALQGTVALLIGLGFSAITFAAGAIAGKRSGLPTLLLSRSAFGVIANQIPGWIVVLGRLALPIALVAIAQASVTDQVGENSFALNLASSGLWITASVVAVLVVIASVLALNYRWAKLANLWLGILSTAASVALGLAVAPSFSFANVEFATNADDNLKVFASAALVYSIFGAVWASIGADYSRELAKRARGLAAAGWTLLGSFVAPAIIGLYFFYAFIGSTGALEQKLSGNFLIAIGSIGAPILTPITLVAVGAFFVLWMTAALAAVKLSVASLGLRERSTALVIAVSAVSLVAGTLGWAWLGNSDLWSVVSSYAQAVAIPIAAWAGIFSADVLIRRISYHEVSLSRAYGFYKSANVSNLAAWLISTVIGLGLASSSRGELAWLGYFANAISANRTDEWSAVSIFFSFGLAFLAPVLFGIPRIKKQESEVLAVEARRDDLKDIFKFAE
jgi:purine-cytosine permease-like protein